MSTKRQRIARTYFCYVLAIICTAAIGGCDKKKSNLAAVKGTVQLNGQPLANGAVITDFANGRGAQGVVKDGTFELGTFSSNDGALIGTHKVAVTANDVDTGSGPESTPGKSLLPQRYNSPASSELTIEVKAGEVNTPTLDLKSP